MMIKAVVLCTLLLASGAIGLADESRKNAVERQNLIPKLAALSDTEKMEALERIGEIHADVARELIGQLREKDVKIEVVYLLGIYRFEEAIPDLSKLITLEYRPAIPWNTGMPLWGQYPCVEALIRIGNPAIPQMIKNVELTQDKKVRELSSRVILKVMGPDITKVILENAMKDKSDAVKANFKAAIESLSNPQSPQPAPNTLTESDRVKLRVPATRPASTAGNSKE